jgi:hypothetical protein
MRNLDFSSWQALLSTLLGLAVITLIGVGIRLIVMQTVQQRRERENRQINERLRTLIAAYKTLGGSFTGNLTVDPVHLRDLRRRTVDTVPAEVMSDETSSDRSCRIRDAVEGALSDVILLGTEEQVRLAAQAAADLAAGRTVHTAELVVSLRDFIRQVLDLEVVPGDVSIPKQGPTRSVNARGAGKSDGAAKDDARSGGRSGSGGMAADGMGGGAAAGAGLGLGLGGSLTPDEHAQSGSDREE